MLLIIEEKHRENFPEGMGCVNCKRRKRITRQKDIKAERRKDKFGKMPKSQLGSVVSAAVIGECNLWQLVVEKPFLVFELISFHPERTLQQSFGRGTNQFSFRLISLSLQYRPKPARRELERDWCVLFIIRQGVAKSQLKRKLLLPNWKSDKNFFKVWYEKI